jgi:hypothetical protein
VLSGAGLRVGNGCQGADGPGFALRLDSVGASIGEWREAPPRRRSHEMRTAPFSVAGSGQDVAWVHEVSPRAGGSPSWIRARRAPAGTPSGDADVPGGWLPSLTFHVRPHEEAGANLRRHSSSVHHAWRSGCHSVCRLGTQSATPVSRTDRAAGSEGRIDLTRLGPAVDVEMHDGEGAFRESPGDHSYD